MTTEQHIKMALAYKGMTMTDLANAMGTSVQNLSQKIKRDSLKREEMDRIAAAIGCKWVPCFMFDDGKTI